MSDGGGGAVAGDDEGFSGQREQPILNAGDDLAGVSAGEICATDSTGEEGIAGDEKVGGGDVETEAASRVAGGVEDGATDAGDA